jgi:hypothetical protein
MSTYFIRLEVHNMSPPEFKLLNANLAAVKFYRFFLSKNKSYWQFPTGLYRTDDESLASVSAKISAVLKRLNKTGEYVIIASGGMTTLGLKPITRAQAVLLNSGENLT